MRKLCKSCLLVVLFLVTVSFYTGCTTGVESSPLPGILKITLQSNPSDTMIVVISDTLVVGEEDYFGNIIFQGRVFSGDHYAFLFPDKDKPQQEDKTYNVIEQIDGEYIQYTIFESYVPPGEYDAIEFGITGDLVKLGYFEIPVKMPEGESPKQKLKHTFTVEENGTTQLHIQLSPFESVNRYRDSYMFRPVLEITNATYTN